MDLPHAVVDHVKRLHRVSTLLVHVAPYHVLVERHLVAVEIVVVVEIVEVEIVGQVMVDAIGPVVVMHLVVVVTFHAVAVVIVEAVIFEVAIVVVAIFVVVSLFDAMRLLRVHDQMVIRDGVQVENGHVEVAAKHPVIDHEGVTGHLLQDATLHRAVGIIHVVGAIIRVAGVIGEEENGDQVTLDVVEIVGQVILGGEILGGEILGEVILLDLLGAVGGMQIFDSVYAPLPPTQVVVFRLLCVVVLPLRVLPFRVLLHKIFYCVNFYLKINRPDCTIIINCLTFIFIQIKKKVKHSLEHDVVFYYCIILLLFVNRKNVPMMA